MRHEALELLSASWRVGEDGIEAAAASELQVGGAGLGRVTTHVLEPTNQPTNHVLEPSGWC